IMRIWSMRQHPDDDVDAECVAGWRVAIEIGLVVTLAFPAVGNVRVHADEHHQAVLVVEDAVVMHGRRTNLGILTIAEPGVDRWNLWKVTQPIHGREHRMLERQVDDLVAGEDLDEVWANEIEVRIPIVIHPEKAALEQVLSQTGSLLIREFVVR